jgi:hypothetical protein
LVVVFGPAAWFGPTGAVLAYVALGIVVLLAAAGWALQREQRSDFDGPAPAAKRSDRLTARLRHRRAPQPPPVPWPPQTPAPPPHR